MRRILRIAAVMAGCAPGSRWWSMGALGCVVAGQLVCAVRSRGAMPAPDAGSIVIGAMLVVMGLAVLVAPLLYAGGSVLRATGPRQARGLALIPQARVRCLSAALLITLALAAFAAANFALLLAVVLRPRVPITFGGALVFLLGFESLLIWLFAAGRGAMSFGLVLAALFVLTHSALPLAGPALETIGVSATVLGTLLIAAGWLAFGAWYLGARGRFVRSGGGVAARDGVARADPAARGGISGPSAMAVQLLGRPSLMRLAARQWLFVVLVVLVVAQPAMRAPDGLFAGGARTYAAFSFLAVAVLGLPLAVVGRGIAGRSRVLWLQGGYGRGEIFRACERLGWRCLGAIAAPIWLLVLAAGIFVPRAAAEWRYLPVAIVMPACGLYLGLLKLREIPFAAVVLIAIAAFMPLMLGASVSDRLPPATPWFACAVMLAVAAALRWWCQLRWRQIDWLAGKPRRLPSGALRPVP